MTTNNPACIQDSRHVDVGGMDVYAADHAPLVLLILINVRLNILFRNTTAHNFAALVRRKT